MISDSFVIDLLVVFNGTLVGLEPCDASFKLADLVDSIFYARHICIMLLPLRIAKVAMKFQVHNCPLMDIHTHKHAFPVNIFL